VFVKEIGAVEVVVATVGLIPAEPRLERHAFWRAPKWVEPEGGRRVVYG
jgi:hypothetical protein